MWFLLIFFFLLAPELYSSELIVNPKALYEVGLLGASGNVSDYPASDQSRTRTLVLPFLIYRGELFRSDEQNGTRLKLLNAERLDLDLSFGGSFPTDADSNEARRGMPALDWTLELGPRLLYYFYKNPHTATVRIGLPLRSTSATNFSNKFKVIGYTLAPTFQVDLYNVIFEKFDLFFIANLNYLNEGQANYFYQVESQYQTPERSTYDAQAGYLSYDLALSAKYEWSKKIVFVGARYADYTESVNRTSSLHRQNIEWNFFVGLGWLFFESDERGVD
jgi:MipA family protein